MYLFEQLYWDRDGQLEDLLQRGLGVSSAISTLLEEETYNVDEFLTL